MKMLILAVVTAFALPLFAIPGNGPVQCSRCIKSCEREKDDVSAQVCLTNCLRKPYCNEPGYGLLQKTSGELVLCSLDSAGVMPACSADQSL